MKKRGTLTFVFDDGYDHILRDIVPLLNAAHIKATFAVPLDPKADTLDGQKLAPVSAWRSVQTAGHELAAHSISHHDLTQLTPSQLQTELAQPAQAIPATTLVYPGGAHDQSVLTAAQPIYRAARTVQKGFETIPPLRPLQLKTYNFTRRNFSVLKANLAALFACLTNKWLIETYHIVSNTDHTSKYAISRDGFTRHLKFVQKLPLNIATIKEII